MNSSKLMHLLKSEIKLELINYYDTIKSDIDVKAQSLLMNEADDEEQSVEDVKKCEIIKRQVTKINIEFANKIDQILEQNMNEMNEYFNFHASFSTSKEEIKMNALKSYCLFISNDNLKQELKDTYRIGILICTNWYLNPNEIQYLRVKFEDNEIKKQIKFNFEEIHTFYINQRNNFVINRNVDNDNDKPTTREIKFNLDENTLNCMYAFGAFGDSHKNLTNEMDNAISLRRENIIDELTKLTKFYINFEKYFTKNIEIEQIEKNTFRNLRNLKELYVRCKSVEKDVFAGLDNLKVLKLNYYENLTGETSEPPVNPMIFNEFKYLSNLKILEISHTNMFVLRENVFEELKNLELFILYRCYIEKIESNAFNNLSNLKKLDLQHNKLAILKENTFAGLNNLEELVLNYCGIEIIEPFAFKNLKNLVSLVMKNNSLDTLRANTFGGLENLNVLNVSNHNDPIRGMDYFVFNNLTNLKTLEVSDVEIDVLREESFNDLLNIEELFLYGCAIECIETNAFKMLTKLKILNLSYNKIMLVKEDGFRGLVNLEQLDISESFIEKIERNVFENLGNLVSLDLAKTQICFFEETMLNGLNNLQILDLSFNNLNFCIMGNFFKQLTGLNKLIISLHELETFKEHTFDGLNNLVELNILFSNAIQPQFEEGHFKNFKSLKKLVLSLESYYSCIQEIDETTFAALKDLKHLEHFDLSKGWIYSIEANSFKHLESLKMLNLSYNNMELVRENAFLGLRNLTHLDLSNCKIEEVEENGFYGLESLDELDISSNPIYISDLNEFKVRNGMRKTTKLVSDTMYRYY